jgi:hypothetical protein
VARDPRKLTPRIHDGSVEPGDRNALANDDIRRLRDESITAVSHQTGGPGATLRAGHHMNLAAVVCCQKAPYGQRGRVAQRGTGSGARERRAVDRQPLASDAGVHKDSTKRHRDVARPHGVAQHVLWCPTQASRPGQHAIVAQQRSLERRIHGRHSARTTALSSTSAPPICGQPSQLWIPTAILDGYPAGSSVGGGVAVQRR